MPRIVPISNEEAFKEYCTNNIIWLKFVINFIDTLPDNPMIGDRYIIKTNDQSNELYFYNNYIFQWNGTIWEKYPPFTGNALLVKQIDDYYFYNSQEWIPLESIMEHNDLHNIQGGIPGERYHLTNREYLLLTQQEDATELHHHDSRYQKIEIDTDDFIGILDDSDNTIEKAINTLDKTVIWDKHMNCFKITTKHEKE